MILYFRIHKPIHSDETTTEFKDVQYNFDSFAHLIRSIHYITIRLINDVRTLVSSPSNKGVRHRSGSLTL